MQQPYAAEYERLYRAHWWGGRREAIRLRLLGQLLGGRDSLEMLDVGCGNALFFPELERFGSVRGIEVDEGLLDPGGPHRARISTKPLGAPEYTGADWQFDLITALDVIEHIDDDRAAVSSVVRMLRPGGLF